MQDHYAVLGVPRNADQELIKATYKALLKIYHPDVFKGDKKFATEQLKKINIAFEILSDPKKRKNYDAHYKENSDKKENTDDFSNEGFRDERTAYQKIIAEEWKYAMGFYPELKGEYESLKKISQQLAFNYQVLLIEGKLFENAVKMAAKVKDDYLTSKFSSDKDLKTIAEILIINRNKRFALDLNKAIKTLGAKSKIRILKKLQRENPFIASKIYRIDNFSSVLGEAEKVKIIYFDKDQNEKTKQSENNNYKNSKPDVLNNHKKNLNETPLFVVLIIYIILGLLIIGAIIEFYS